jgi:DNA mismatch repair ATPase MutS
MFKLEEIGANLCKPELFPREEKVFDVTGLYNAALAISLNSGELVLNDITFDKNGMIYILTGPNRGGKSVITCAVGIAQLFCQLGMLIPAQSAKISPVDCIYTHFAGNYDTFEKGRLGEECEPLNAILNAITQYSLVLLDETLSSTGSFEGSYIAAEVVEGLSFLGCRCIYSTHMHELASLVGEINVSGKNKVDTLVAGMEEGERSFKIRREKPDGKSYAKDIAQKYGISSKKIRKRAECINII